MYISRIQVGNYKSFREPVALDFREGFNVISGQNNAGKTALLEAIGLDFIGKPHRSLKTLPARDTVPDEFSRVDVSFTVPVNELKELMLSLPEQEYQIVRPIVGSPFALNVGYRDDSFDSALRLVNQILSEQVLTFRTQCRAQRNHGNSWAGLDVPSYGLYQPQRQNTNDVYCGFRFDLSHRISITRSGFLGGPHDLGVQLAPTFKRHVYRFSAERMNVGFGAHGAGTLLSRDASNLPEVLNQLQHNSARFRQLNRQLSSILPQVRWVSVRGVSSNQVEIVVWPHDPESQREDLAVPLLESGTGIAQVLAILYVVMTSERPQVIIIDEPQSFLHPGAARKLIDFLRGYPQHQFIIATHSATIIAAANPQTITLARFEDGETVLQQLDAKAEKGVQIALADLGVRLADLFGADNILWVEGRTEEKCFPIIIEKMLGRRLMGTQVLGIRQTGDLESRDARRVFEIYNSLTNAASFLPPAIAFVLDQECRDDATKEDLRKLSGGLARYLPRRMYENYLLNPFAITTVVNSLDGFRAQPVVVEEVRAAIESKLNDPEFYCGRRAVPPAAERPAKVDGAWILERVFSELSDTRVPYQKVTHGVLLTECLVENAPEDLTEVADLLSEILEGR
jgi:RecF/RecN/SMC N terminal domain